MPKPSPRRDSPPGRRSNWSNSNRRSRLPPDWPKIRKRQLRADSHECQHVMPDGDRCGEKATDVDHIKAGDNHHPSNLQSLCGRHHRAKSSGEGGEAKAAKRKKIETSFNTAEEHPGEI